MPRRITDGLTILGLLPCTGDGVGEERRGMDSTADILRRIQATRQPRSGLPTISSPPICRPPMPPAQQRMLQPQTTMAADNQRTEGDNQPTAAIIPPGIPAAVQSP